ncbi:hypothetical protein [Hymenobacter latericus]|uniref:hypothetical protein n=1 Tax=Hymenobacter sp. YIM 151858-1 TaxID=2987688 RepID=UPI002225C86C|nr:hypothetical protein [Hymenobacter sp. YIM 151858-1]UYZ60083.1 hypothetical protein OIS50_04605 [Hymenobacter sp. YIM 151858-1]
MTRETLAFANELSTNIQLQEDEIIRMKAQQRMQKLRHTLHSSPAVCEEDYFEKEIKNSEERLRKMKDEFERL